MAPCITGIECIAGGLILIVGTILTNPVWLLTGALVGGGLWALRAPPGRWRK